MSCEDRTGLGHPMSRNIRHGMQGVERSETAKSQRHDYTENRKPVFCDLSAIGKLLKILETPRLAQGQALFLEIGVRVGFALNQ